MKIYITVELFGGCVHEVEAYVSEEEANKKLVTWEIKNEIVDESDRENQAHNRGIEFHIFECELKGLFEKIKKLFIAGEKFEEALSHEGHEIQEKKED